jgi:hypothetical protein
MVQLHIGCQSTHQAATEEGQGYLAASFEWGSKAEKSDSLMGKLGDII